RKLGLELFTKVFSRLSHLLQRNAGFTHCRYNADLNQLKIGKRHLRPANTDCAAAIAADSLPIPNGLRCRFGIARRFGYTVCRGLKARLPELCVGRGHFRTTMPAPYGRRFAHSCGVRNLTLSPREKAPCLALNMSRPDFACEAVDR